MQRPLYKGPTTYSNRKVSVNQAIKLLKRNGILTNEDQAKQILDFLYLLAKTYKDVEIRPIEE